MLKRKVGEVRMRIGLTKIVKEYITKPEIR
jgi:hypothetical protein